MKGKAVGKEGEESTGPCVEGAKTSQGSVFVSP